MLKRLKDWIEWKMFQHALDGIEAGRRPWVSLEIRRDPHDVPHVKAYAKVPITERTMHEHIEVAEPINVQAVKKLDLWKSQLFPMWMLWVDEYGELALSGLNVAGDHETGLLILEVVNKFQGEMLHPALFSAIGNHLSSIYDGVILDIRAKTYWPKCHKCRKKRVALYISLWDNEGNEGRNRFTGISKIWPELADFCWDCGRVSYHEPII